MGQENIIYLPSLSLITTVATSQLMTTASELRASMTPNLTMKNCSSLSLSSSSTISTGVFNCVVGVDESSSAANVALNAVVLKSRSSINY